LAQFDHSPQPAVRAYRQFVAEGMEEAPWQELTGQSYYGDGTFVTKVAETTPSSEVPRRQRQPVGPALALLLKSGRPEEVGMAYRKVTVHRWTSPKTRNKETLLENGLCV
jgi:hypothetical protein